MQSDDGETGEGTKTNSSADKENTALVPDLPDSVPEKTDKKPKRAKLPPPEDTKPVSKRGKKVNKGSLPDFTSISNAAERKKRFVSFMAPIIKKENAEIMATRKKIQKLYVAYILGQDIPQEKIEWLNDLAKKYRVKERDFPSQEAFRALLMHVDIIPLDLALAQAANESAWGTSYFATKGNNIFGKWCFTEGCGIVPRRRGEGSTHEVKVYKEVSNSVSDYLHHVNSHPVYRQLRVLRYEQREKGETPDGSHIAVGLQKYSAIGMKYVDILRSMIKNNQDLIDQAMRGV